MNMTGVLCGKEWFENHQLDVTQKMIDAQTLTVSYGARTSILKASYKVKDIKTVLKGVKA